MRELLTVWIVDCRHVSTFAPFIERAAIVSQIPVRQRLIQPVNPMTEVSQKGAGNGKREREREKITHQSVVAGMNATFSRGTFFGTKELTGWATNMSAFWMYCQSWPHASCCGEPGISIKSLRIWIWLRNITGLSGCCSFAILTNKGICGSSTMMKSAPPSDDFLKGPPSHSQYRSAFSCIQSVIFAKSAPNRSPGGATPCRMLWHFLVTLNTVPRGFGTYLNGP